MGKIKNWTPDEDPDDPNQVNVVKVWEHDISDINRVQIEGTTENGYMVRWYNGAGSNPIGDSHSSKKEAHKEATEWLREHPFAGRIGDEWFEIDFDENPSSELAFQNGRNGEILSIDYQERNNVYDVSRYSELGNYIEHIIEASTVGAGLQAIGLYIHSDKDAEEVRETLQRRME